MYQRKIKYIFSNPVVVYSSSCSNSHNYNACRLLKKHFPYNSQSLFVFRSPVFPCAIASTHLSRFWPRPRLVASSRAVSSKDGTRTPQAVARSTWGRSDV